MSAQSRTLAARAIVLSASACALLTLLAAPTPLTAGGNDASAEMTVLLPFDAKIYELSYQIFLANRNLRDAYRVAVAAVRQRPKDDLWRERLAQVAEWNQNPSLALASWRQLTTTRGDNETWEQVRRLAPALFDYRTVVEVMQHDARADALDEKGLDQLVIAYENAGIPEQGVKFFDSLDRMRPRQAYLEKKAFLQSRMGRDEDAIETYNALTKRHGPKASWALSTATLYILHADLESAYGALSAARAGATPADAAYWEMLATLAVYTQRGDEARETYRQLVQQNPDNIDLLTRLLNLLNSHPEEALRLSEYGWKQHHDESFLIRALNLHAQLRTFRRGKELIASLKPEERKRLEDNPRFLSARGGLDQGLGYLDSALRDYESAMRISPNDTPLRVLWLWLIIEKNDEARMRRAVRVLGNGTSGEMLDILAAIHVTLGDAHAALPLFRRRLDAHMDDHVWIMGYADVLEDAGYPGLARSLRARAKSLLQKIAPMGQRWAWPLAARLALAHSPGDPVAQIMRELLALDGTSHEVDNATADALILWLMRSEQYERAKLWFWRRYAHALKKPAWAEFAVALLDRDRPRMAEMLSDEDLRRQIDKYDRVQAAKILDEPFMARDFAFNDLEKYHTDPTLEKDLVELLPDTANVVGFEAGFGERGVVEGPEFRLFGHWPLNRGLAFDARFQSNHPSVSEPTAIANVPDMDNTLEGLLSWRHQRLGRSNLRIGLRDALAIYPFGEVTHEHDFGNVHTRIALGSNLLADEGTAIRLGGRQDRLQFNLDWSLTERNFISLEAAASRYETQDDEALGSGRRVQATVGHRFRLRYPDLTLRTTYGLYGYKHEGIITGDAAQLKPEIAVDENGNPVEPTPADAGFFLPQDYAQYGVYLGFGERYRENYTHNWRPFLDFGVTWNTVSGLGTDVTVGIGGKVIGDDHLSISFDRASGGGGLGETDQMLWLNYRYFY